MPATNGVTTAADVRAPSDPFLSSMTFAVGVQRDCDCDECGLCIEGGGFGSGAWGGTDAVGGGGAVPADVAEAVREHKRARLAAGVVTRRQERVLVARDGGASIYQLTLPPGAEPLVEFGNSHRIVVVDRMKKVNAVKSIGRGIMGSSDEEKGRKVVPWEEGKAYFIPCNGGRALGWVNEKAEGGAAELGGNVVLYMVKITPDAMEDILDDKEFTAEWVRDILHVFQKHVGSSGSNNAMEQDPNEHPKGALISDSEHSTLMSLLPPLLKMKGL